MSIRQAARRTCGSFDQGPENTSLAVTRRVSPEGPERPVVPPAKTSALTSQRPTSWERCSRNESHRQGADANAPHSRRRSKSVPPSSATSRGFASLRARWPLVAPLTRPAGGGWLPISSAAYHAQAGNRFPCGTAPVRGNERPGAAAFLGMVRQLGIVLFPVDGSQDSHRVFFQEEPDDIRIASAGQRLPQIE